MFAEVNGRRKPENGLVVTCIYHVNGNKKHTETFSEDINNLKNGKVIHINIQIFVSICVNMYKEETSFV